MLAESLKKVRNFCVKRIAKITVWKLKRKSKTEVNLNAKEKRCGKNQVDV